MLNVSLYKQSERGWVWGGFTYTELTDCVSSIRGTISLWRSWTMPMWWNWRKWSEKTTTFTLYLSTWGKTSISSCKKGKNRPHMKFIPSTIKHEFVWKQNLQRVYCVTSSFTVFLLFLFSLTGKVRLIQVNLSHRCLHVTERNCCLSHKWLRYYMYCPLFVQMVQWYKQKEKQIQLSLLLLMISVRVNRKT